MIGSTQHIVGVCVNRIGTERSKHDDLAKENDRLSRLERVRTKLEVTFGKHRGGPCPVLEFYADMGCGVIRDMDFCA